MKKQLFLFLFVITLSAASPKAPLPSDTKSFFVEVDHARLFCRSMGEGTPLIVLHGGPGLSQDYLQPYLSKLAENHFVIFYDQRGSGRSEGEIDSTYINLSVFLNDLEAIRQHFGLEKVSILGHSFGGFLAMHYAISHPEAIDKLILLNSAPSSSEGWALLVEEYYRRMAPFMEEIERLQASEEFAAGDPGTVAHYLKTLFRTYCAIPEKADELNFLASPQANINFIKTSEILRQTLFASPFDLREELKKLSCKTLIVHGDKDTIPLSTAETLHTNIRDSKLVVIEDCGHFPYVEKEQELFDALNDFFADGEESSCFRKYYRILAPSCKNFSYKTGSITPSFEE